MVGADQFFEADLYASALEWWRDAGVDVLTQESPRDWLAGQAPPPLIARAPAQPAAAEATDAAALPDTLDAFLAWRSGEGAPDFAWGGEQVLASGPANARLMVLLDQPDRDDCAAGVLLSGPVGRLFDRMLAAIGLRREEVYMTSVCVRRSASGRAPRAAEAALAEAALHYLALVSPARLLLLGDAASRAVLGSDAAAARGISHRVRHKSGTGVAVASFHPRLLLQRPAAKAEAWRDLRLLNLGEPD